MEGFHINGWVFRFYKVCRKRYFNFGKWYIDLISVLDLPVFIIGLIVLRRDSFKDTILMSLSSVGLAILIKIFFPFV